MTLTSLGMTSSEVDTASDLPRTKIRRAWYSGFMGYINLPISEDVDFGWKMILDFRRRIKYFEVRIRIFFIELMNSVYSCVGACV